MNLVELLNVQVAARPDAAAIIDVLGRRSRSVSFSELERASQQAAAFLQQSGLTSGDVVLIFHRMSAELYAALLGIWRLGLVAMFLDPSAGREYLEQCCAIQPPRALLAGARAHLLRFLSPALRRIPIKISMDLPLPGALFWRQASRFAPCNAIHRCTPEAPALITFTSGSTGQPKAALRTHGFLLAQHRVLENALHLEPGEVDLTTLPIFLLANLASGVTSVIPDADLRFPGAIDPGPVLAQIEREGPTRIGASPALLERLLGGGPDSQRSLRILRKIYIGGAPVFPPLLDQWHLAAPHAEIVSVYGSTEAEPIAHLERNSIQAEDRAAMRNGSGLLAGRPIEQIQLRILRDRWGQAIGPFMQNEFNAACLGPGEAGEIVVSGEHVLTRYLRGQGEAETKFDVSSRRWHRTGDAGYLDRQGRLWLLGRCSARIEDERGTLYPFTVETAVHHLAAVRRVAVVLHLGQRLLAVERSQSDELPLNLKDSLAWAHIDRIRIFKTLPVDPRHNAKIDYPALKKLIAAHIV